MRTRFFTITALLICIIALLILPYGEAPSVRAAQNDLPIPDEDPVHLPDLVNGTVPHFVRCRRYEIEQVVDAATRTGNTTRVSIASDGGQGNNISSNSSISADGRYVAFDSRADNLVPGDTNDTGDIFVHDRQTSQTSRVSVASDGSQGNDRSAWPSISADGRYVAFWSQASDLVSGDTNECYGETDGHCADIFVHDRQTGQTSRVSVASDGTQGNSQSLWSPSISADGRYVAFESDASNLVSGDTNECYGKTDGHCADIFVHDRQTSETVLVSVSSDGISGNHKSTWPSISADGRYVAFESWASDLVSDDTNGSADIFVRDLQTGQTTRVSVASAGSQADRNSMETSISADGRYVAFKSCATNLVSESTNNWHIFVHDRQTSETVLVSVSSDGIHGDNWSCYPAVSANGRYVAFSSEATNLVSDDTNGESDVFLHDKQTGQTIRVSVASDGTQGNAYSSLRDAVSLSTDGHQVAFSSVASNLVSGDTNGDRDIFVHDRGSESPSILPVYPVSHTTPSIVMQGGTSYRHLRLLDGGGGAVADATVAFSIGNPVTTDTSGYFTYTVAADALGGTGVYPVSVQTITYGGQTHPTGDQPVFSVAVIERQYAHIWEFGTAYKAGAGLSGEISYGLVAYLAGETNGGVAITLDESNPNTTTDDIVTMAQYHTGDEGVGYGARFSPSVDLVLAEISGPGAYLVGETFYRTEARVSNIFHMPYQTADREIQGLMLIGGIADAVSSFPSEPLIASIISRVSLVLPYYEFESAMGLHDRVELGINGLQIKALVGKKDAELTAIDLDLVAATADRTVIAGNKYYDSQISDFYTLDLKWQASGLGTQIGPVKNLVGDYVGEYVGRVHEEVVYDYDTEQVNHIELSMTGNGNGLTFTDIDQNLVTVSYIIPGDQVTQEVLGAAYNLSGLIRGIESSQSAHIRVGNDPIVSEINGLIGSVGYAEYEITVEDGAELDLVPEVGLEAGLKLNLGGGLELKRARQLVYQQGVFLSGQLYPTASYQADDYVAQPGKSWLQLSLNALGGLWDLVKDTFMWVYQQVTSGVSWAIGTISKTASDVVLGGAQIAAPAGTRLYETGSEPQLRAIQPTEAITVTAVSWVPTSTVGTGTLDLGLARATASGDDFVIGGIYEFQPYTLTMNPAATLVITYTDEASAGVNESHIEAFRWNPDDSNWQPMGAISDTARNIFTTTITQLGTFALGYDGTPPLISISEPVSGSTILNQHPLFAALVADAGTGIDPTSVEMRLSDQIVTATYITATGQLFYLSSNLLENGKYTITVSAADVMGNHNSASVTFTVEVHRVYLPVILREH